MLKYIIILSSIFFILVGSSCGKRHGKPTRVVLKHPVTYDFVNCNVDKWQSKESFEANDKCIKEYEDKGYEIWGTKQ